jgi:serine-type D-Ala-D-Ala carboxypeptidase
MPRNPLILAGLSLGLALTVWQAPNGQCTVDEFPPTRPEYATAALKRATENQDQRFETAFAAIEKWIDEEAFPGAVLAVGHGGSLIAMKAFGGLEWHKGARRTQTDTIFDLASVSKVVGTTTAAAILCEKGLLSLDGLVIDYLPEFACKPGHERVTIRHLLAHSSGMHAQRRFYLETQNRAELLTRLFGLDLLSEPGELAVYRDYNMMLLGEIIERISDQGLDRFLEKKVFAPLGMKDTLYNPPKRLRVRIAPTEFDGAMRKRMVRGEVHDENCFILGGVCGHAGLFSTAPDLAIFAQMMLNRGIYRGKRILKSETVDLFTARQLSPAGTTRGLGWGVPHGSFAGELASPKAFTHTGFTGTSLCIDPERDAFIVLLTNRVHPTRANQKFIDARVGIHTEVLTALDGQ